MHPVEQMLNDVARARDALREEVLDPLQQAGLASLLKERLASLNVKHTFGEGDLVEWKPGLSNKKSAGPFIVVQVLDTPIVEDRADTGSQYYREPLDLVLGKLDSEGEFLTYHYDSRRMQPYTGKLAEDI